MKREAKSRNVVKCMDESLAYIQYYETDGKMDRQHVWSAINSTKLKTK